MVEPVRAPHPVGHTDDVECRAEVMTRPGARAGGSEDEPGARRAEGGETT
ncbi:MAG: hypothetical protein KatS3mg010_2082 [Acidimicrobiia bacterium]|nr:MAG: hypothetical protein KatS3mg010_2082 [Acidimicrobiia bacterium]